MHSSPHEPQNPKKYRHEALRIVSKAMMLPPITPPRNQYGHFFQRILMLVPLAEAYFALGTAIFTSKCACPASS